MNLGYTAVQGYGSLIRLALDRGIFSVCGEIDIKKPWYKEQFAILTNLFVKEEFRRKNIGTYLMDAFKEIVKVNGVNKIEVNTCFNSNTAISFYKKNGFKDLSRQLILDI